MVISGVTNLMAGATQVVRAYAGSTEVWSHIVYTYLTYEYNDSSNPMVPNVSSGFGANIVQDQYLGGGVWRYTFDGVVTKIPAQAFSGNTDLIEFDVPNTVGSISSQVFSGCTSLNKFIMPDNVVALGTSSFRHCYSLEKFVFSSGVTSVPAYSFTDDSALTSVTLNSVMTDIKQAAFRDCTALPAITLPATLTNIEKDAFLRCQSLSNITFLGTKSQWGSVTKGTDWASGVSASVVHCSDGDIAI